jgi:ParB-like chromosome segregation protein Spo0J
MENEDAALLTEDDISISKFAKNTFDPFDLVIIGLDTDDGPEHCLYVDNVKDKLHEEDILNVMAYGILQPVEFRKNGSALEVVYGRHRVRWLREANTRAAKNGGEIRRLRAFRHSGDESKLGRRVTVENAIRHQPGCVVDAKSAMRMRDRGDSDGVIAIALGYGKDVTKVKKLISLLDLEKTVFEALENGQISESTGYEFAAKLSREEQLVGFNALKAEGKVTVEGAKRVAAAAKSKKTGKKAVVASAAPKKPLLKRFVQHAEIGTLDLSVWDTMDLLKWSLGMKDAASIKGLTAALKLAEKAPKKATK